MQFKWNFYSVFFRQIRVFCVRILIKMTLNPKLTECYLIDGNPAFTQSVKPLFSS